MAKDNQHFVPQFYLRGFSIKGEKSLIWEYDKSTGLVSNHPRSVRYICSRPQYYAQEDEQGEVDKDKLENALEKLEDMAARIIRKIVSGREPIVLSEDEKEDFSYFAALLITRGPSYRNGNLDYHENILRITYQHALDAGELPPPPPELDEVIKKDQIRFAVKPWVSLPAMLQMAEQGAISILNKRWYLCKGPVELPFITSDNPCTFSLPNGVPIKPEVPVGPFHPMSEIVLPVDNDHVVIFSPTTIHKTALDGSSDIGCLIVDKNYAKNINRRTARAARRYVYSSIRSAKLAKMVGKMKGHEQRNESMLLPDNGVAVRFVT